jgi:hypothetical protein
MHSSLLEAPRSGCLEIILISQEMEESFTICSFLLISSLIRSIQLSKILSKLNSKSYFGLNDMSYHYYELLETINQYWMIYDSSGRRRIKGGKLRT